jgi:hypothetical protein
MGGGKNERTFSRIEGGWERTGRRGRRAMRGGKEAESVWETSGSESVEFVPVLGFLTNNASNAVA